MNNYCKAFSVTAALLLITAMITQTAQAQEDQQRETSQIGLLKAELLQLKTHLQQERQQLEARSDKIQKVIEQRNRQLLEAHEQLGLAHREFERQLQKQLPPLENGQLRVFQLRAIDPEEVAEVLHELLGPTQLRLAPDPDHSRLLVYAHQKVAAEIEALIQQLDVPEEPEDSYTEEGEEHLPESLLVRIYWLADGLPEGEGRDPGSSDLPASVRDAMHNLGLNNPRIVSQNMASIALSKEEDYGGGFQFNLPAIVHGEPVRFTSQGELQLADENRARLHMEMHVSQAAPQYGGGKTSIKCELTGSMTAPLGHYMVLGTANYVAKERHLAERNPFGSGRGGRFESKGTYGRVEGTYGNRGGDMGTVGPEESTPKQKPSISRFAFVVQVLEAGSYAPEE